MQTLQNLIWRTLCAFLAAAAFQTAAATPPPLSVVLTNHFLPVIAGVTNTNHRSAAFGLNAGCVTVGWATLNNNAQRAALWLPGATNAIDLNTRRQPGFTRLLVSAAAVTDGGIIVGQCPDAEGVSIGWIAYPVYKRH